MTRFIVGIDLGTTNTVVAYAEKSAGPDAVPAIFDIEQLVAPGAVAARSSLPSLRYHPAPDELDPDDLGLPWSREDVGGVPDAVIGSLARDLGSQVPGRQVASAKSWLSHPAVDRSAAILPWGAAEDGSKNITGTRQRQLSCARARRLESSFPRAPAGSTGDRADRSGVLR